VVEEVVVVVVQLLHFVALGHENIQVFLTPLGGGQVLQEQQSILETHLFQLLRKLKEQSSTYIAMKL
jgi:hypothetical protein